MPAKIATLSLLAVVLSLYGCPGGDDCVSNSDCFSGEACSSGKCVPDDGLGADLGADDTGASGGDDAAAAEDTGDEPRDMSTIEDAGADLSGSPDSGADASDDTCVVDPFTYECTDDPGEDDDRWTDGTRLTQTILGCNPDFVAFDETFLGTICPRDGTDWFYVNFRSCEEMQYVLEYQVEILGQCAEPDLFHVEPLSFECSEDFVECTVEDGKPTVRMLVDETLRNLQSMYVQIHTDGRNDVTSEYRISLTVRE